MIKLYLNFDLQIFTFEPPSTENIYNLTLLKDQFNLHNILEYFNNKYMMGELHGWFSITVIQNAE